MNMDLEKIKKLIEFVGRSSVSELSVTENGTTVRIIKGDAHRAEPGVSDGSASGPVQRLEPIAAKPDQPVSPESHIIRAPSAGVFHRAPDPSSSPFVEVGTVVEKGQGLCIIEAMKVFNTIPATHTGQITRIIVSDGNDVDVGQPLFEIK